MNKNNRGPQSGGTPTPICEWCGEWYDDGPDGFEHDYCPVYDNTETEPPEASGPQSDDDDTPYPLPVPSTEPPF